MTDFEKLYAPTDPQLNLAPAFVLCGKPLTFTPVVGAYNDGLFSILDDNQCRRLSRAWRSVIGDESLALVATSFGDFYYWDGASVGFVEVQRGGLNLDMGDTEWLVQHVLCHDLIRTNVLKLELFTDIKARIGSLMYGEVFILEPWLMFGGVDEPENYGKGELEVYNSLVAQTIIGDNLSSDSRAY